MSKIFISELTLIFLGSLLVGGLYIGPPLMVRKNFIGSGHEFVLAQYKTYRDSMHVYLPRAREIYDGHYPPAELYDSDKSSKQLTIQNLLPTTLFAALVFLFEGNVDYAYLGAQFLFAGIIFSLFYVLGRILFSSRAWSLFFSLTAVLTSIPLRLPFYKWQGWSEFQAFFINGFFPMVRTQFDQLYLARIDEPLLTYPIYIAAILSFFIFWKRFTTANAVLSGFLAGLLSYTYFHHWVYWVSVLLILFGWVVFFGRTNKGKFKSYLVLLFSLAVTLVPYFWQYLNFKKLATAQDFVFRAGVAYGRTIGLVRANVPDYLVYILMAGLVYWVYRKRDNQKCILFLGLIGGMFLVWNIQLVVGYLPVPHFFRRSISPVLFIIIFNIIYDVAKIVGSKWRYLSGTYMVVLALLSLFMVTKKINNIFLIDCCIQTHIADYYKFPDELAESWRWINTSLDGEPNVLSPSTMTSFYLTTHTSVRPFLPTAFITMLSMAEMEERYLKSHKFFDMPDDIFSRRIGGKLDSNCYEYECFPDKGSNLNDSFGDLYGNYVNSRFGSFKSFTDISYTDPIYKKRREIIENMSEHYSKVLPNKYEINVDYVYAGPLEEQINKIDFARYDNLTLVYKNPSVGIYKMR